MHPEDIKATLRKRGTSFAQIARDLSVDRSTVTNAVKGVHRSRRIEKAVAEALGKELREVFPSRYACVVCGEVA
ncbi:MAG: helix-turn-helix domain-containing protein [Cyanobacteria bacterium P01_C01_bin.120]